mgnify:CR=1 FL=1|tara:strand:+ start:279 stop:524 length:246 start_codon:yes stop_codon:yes gene_type:complete
MNRPPIGGQERLPYNQDCAGVTINQTNEQRLLMSELAFAMIVAIVGSVMIFLIILALFYILMLATIKVFKKLIEQWESPDT